MICQENVKTIQDAIDNMSGFGEKMGLRLNKFIKFIGRKISLFVVLIIFGVIVGMFGHFFKGLFNIKQN